MQWVNHGYASALLTVQKVRSGNLSAKGAIGAIEAVRVDIDMNWRTFRDHALDSEWAASVTQVAAARRDADAAINRLIADVRAA